MNLHRQVNMIFYSLSLSFLLMIAKYCLNARVFLPKHLSPVLIHNFFMIIFTTEKKISICCCYIHLTPQSTWESAASVDLSMNYAFIKNNLKFFFTFIYRTSTALFMYPREITIIIKKKSIGNDTLRKSIRVNVHGKIIPFCVCSVDDFKVPTNNK